MDTNKIIVDITKLSQDITITINTLSLEVINKLDIQQQKVWLDTLIGFREELSSYEECMEPIPIPIPSTENIASSLKVITDLLNNLSEEDRAKFVTKEQMD